ncbi:hypothetical protein QYF36_015297 [Acer negundo]|nr:hypothetical protein QYF36_015297 [Acer negundo]
MMMMMIDDKHNCTCALFFFFLLLSSLIASPCHAAVSPCNPNDGDSLLSLFRNISSPSPLNWSPSLDCCLWEGVDCDDTDGRVTHLRLPSRGLSGSFLSPPATANLTSLSHLNLSHNRLFGPLPSGFFSSLNHLQILDLSYNRLTGELPSNDDNNITMDIQNMDLSSNHFHGAIPSTSFLQATWNITSFNCSQLQILRAGFNNLSGPVPEDIYNITSLEQLSLAVNSLSGPISDSILRLTNLRVLELYSNHFNGFIPTDIGKLSNLEYLLLHINNLTGSLPPSLMNCIKLKTLNLRVNIFKGPLSAFNFSTLTQLNTLDLGNNNFTGTLPSTLYSCKSLTAVRLASNQLEGQISPDILALQSLSFLSISTNNITDITGALQVLMGCRNLTTLIITNNFKNEPMPQEENTVAPDGFQNLQVLGLGGCQFTGQVPIWLAKLKKLEVLDLSVNQFTGPIPGWFGNLARLFYIDLSSNSLTGEFPKELTQLSALATQEIIDEVQRSYLELPVFVKPNNATNQQYNQLSNLPPAIYLRNNSLSGNIPAEIGQLNVAYNNLQGSIPSGGQFDTFPTSSFDGNPALCGSTVQHSCSETAKPNHPAAPRKSTNTKLIVGLILGICFGTGLIIAVLALWMLSKRRIIPGGDTDNIEPDAFSSNSNFGFLPEAEKNTSLVISFPDTDEIKDLTISELLKATDNFNQANIIGCGGFGLVYKATLAEGTKLAVKKLSGDLGLMDREFKAEVEALSTAQHNNLHIRNEGKQDQVFDPLLRGKGFDEEMLQVLDVSCMCVNQNPFKRPTIQEVVHWLKNVGATHRNENKSL